MRLRIVNARVALLRLRLASLTALLYRLLPVALTRKKLWIATYAALCVAALLFVLFGPKRRNTPPPDIPAPAAQLGVSSGCEVNELPKSLEDNPPQIPDPSGPKDETPEMKRARERITACVLHKLWPTASIQFKWDENGAGDFDLVFPNNAYRRPSVISMSQISATREGITFAAFVWLPHQRELDMPPVAIARADAAGRVNYVNAIVIDADAQISEEQPPHWTEVQENRFGFAYVGGYGDSRQKQVAWTGTIDIAGAELAARVPTEVIVRNEHLKVTQESADGASVVLNASGAGHSQNVRVGCERISGSDCVVNAKDLLDQLQ